jgi:hypothetical protein
VSIAEGNRALRAAQDAADWIARQNVEVHEQRGIIDAAVAWFDAHRPQWGPGTLPTWYVDARAHLRHTDDT